MTIRALILRSTLLTPCRPLRKKNGDAIVMKNRDRFTSEIKVLSAGVLSSN